MVTEIEILVRSTEIDVNGHVNNAKYLEYLEWGREDWYEQLHLDYQTLKDLGVSTVVVRVCANYRKEAIQNDRLRIRSWMASVGNTSFKMNQEIYNQRNELVLDAEFVIVTVNPDTHTKVVVPEVLRTHIHTASDV